MSLSTPRLALSAAVLMTVTMVSALSWQGYMFWRQEQRAASSQMASTPVSRETRKATPVDLASLDLFGRADGNSAPVQQTENLPETNLRIFLRGVMAADGDYPASALIEGSDGKTEVYVSGDELPGNAQLRSVFPNRVVLERSGKLENLYFPQTDDSSGMLLEPDQSISEPTTDTTYDQPASMVTPTPANAEQRREQIRQRLEQLRERLKANSN